MNNQNYLWFSRLSFGFSVAALISSLVGGCQTNDPSVGPEQDHVRSNLAAAEQAPSEPRVDSNANDEAKTKGETKTTERSTEKPADSDSKPRAEDPQPKVTKTEPTDEAERPDTPASSEGLELARLIVTQKIDNREPEQADEMVMGDSPIIAFVEMKNGGEAPAKILVTFEEAEGDSKVGFVELDVPPNKHGWRTWGHTRMIKAPGQWVAVVQGADGRELGRTPFTVRGG